MPACYTFNISTETLSSKQNMNRARQDHGLLKITQKIFAFGGSDTDTYMKSAEVYDVAQNSWKNLPDMLKGSDYVSCV